VNKGNGKNFAALGLMGLAVALYIYRTRDEPVPDNDDTRTYWYCTREHKGFSLTGPEAQEKVRIRRKQTAEDDKNPLAFRGREVSESVALSPFSKEYTGVEAYKCPKCGEIFAAHNDKGEDTVCPKCKWDPLATDQEPVGKSETPQT
jgi:ribosomal protein S27AE